MPDKSREDMGISREVSPTLPTLEHGDSFGEELCQEPRKDPFWKRITGGAEKRVVNPYIAYGRWTARISEHPLFEPYCLCVILANALWIGVETDHTDPKEPSKPTGVVAVENMFTFLFSVEILLRILAYRSVTYFFTDVARRHWNWFDLCLVLLSVFEVWLVPMSGGKGPNVGALTSLRLLRLLRIVRVFRMVPELTMMIKSLWAAMRSVSMTGVLALGIMYVFSVLLTQWAVHHDQSGECDGLNCVRAAFGSIPKSFLTLSQLACFDNCFSLIRVVLEESSMYGLLLIVFLLITAFTVLNMLIGIICQIVSKTHNSESSKFMKDRVETLFDRLDQDNSGFLSRKEVTGAHAVKELGKVGVDREVLETAFRIVDYEHDGQLKKSEFRDMLFKLMSPPETQDILLIGRKLEKIYEALRSAGNDPGLHDGSREILWKMNELERHLGAVERQSKDLGPAFDADSSVERQLQRLDDAMHRLRLRLDRCVKTCAREEKALRPWRKSCEDVASSLSTACVFAGRGFNEERQSTAGPPAGALRKR